MSTFIPGRGWSRNGGGAFRTRVEGHQRSRKIWVCTHCRGWNESTTGKPDECISCKGPNKFFAKCDSAVEAERLASLWFQQDQGLISNLRHHPRYDLVVPNGEGELLIVAVYEADFSYERNEELMVEDVKPRSPDAQDPVFKLKRKMFEHQFGITIRIVY